MPSPDGHGAGKLGRNVPAVSPTAGHIIVPCDARAVDHLHQVYARCSSSTMSFRAGYCLAGCSPTEPASPTTLSNDYRFSAGSGLSGNGNLSLISVPQHKGATRDLIRALSAQVSGKALQALPPATQNDVIAFFTQSWVRRLDGWERW